MQNSNAIVKKIYCIVINSQTLFNKNDIQFLLLKKAGKYYKRTMNI